VISVPFKIWGFNPDDGKPRWWCDGLPTDSICASPIAHDDVVYTLETGPRGGGAMAVRAGGEGDVTKTNVLWSVKERSRIGTPVVDNGRIYWFGSRIANCIDATTGKLVYRTRFDGGAVPETPGPAAGARAKRTRTGRTRTTRTKTGRRIPRPWWPRRLRWTGLFFARPGQRNGLFRLPVRRGVCLCNRTGVQIARTKPLCLG